MQCTKCGSENVKVMVTSTEKAKALHGPVYWALIGWWLQPILWLCATPVMFIWRLIRPNRKTKTVTVSMAVCQDCGNTWKVKQ